MVQGRCRKDVGRLSISIIMPAPSPTGLLYNRLVHDDVNGDDLDEDQYRHWVLSVGGDKLRCKELLGAKSFRLRI